MPGLRDSINIELWQKTQDNFAKDEQYPIATIDLDGNEVSVSNKFSFFCQMVKNKNPELCRECRRNNLDNSEDAAILTCHAGLSYVLAPFKINDVKLGAVLYEGFLTNGNQEELRKKCYDLSQKTGLEKDELLDELKKMPVFDKNKAEMAKYLAKMIAKTLPDLCYQDYKSKKELSELKVVQKITSMLNSTLDLDNILQSMVTFLVERLDIKNCSIILLENSKRYVYSESQANILKPAEAVILKQITSTGNPTYVLSLKDDFMMKDVKDISKMQFSVSSLPIVFRKKLLGIINLYSADNAEMDSDLIQLVKVVVDQAAVALVNAFQYKQTAESAITDKLTDLYNRRYFNENFKEEIEKGKAESRPISLIMFDIDDFKMINDTAGHIEGDRILKEMGEITKKNIRDDDFACRYGGEEFVVILPNAKLEEAQAVAERLRKSVEEGISKIKNYAKPVTISLGIVTCQNSSAHDSMMLSEADNALYKAKSRGKNRLASSLIIDKNLGVVDVDQAHDAYVR
jgi:diguanylate cyclase (GGDEF)-like protein